MAALKAKPLDNFFDNNIHNEENQLPENLRPASKEEDPHQTHSVEWQFGDKKPRISVTCNKARTIENLLKKSSQFISLAQKNKDKELIVLRDGKALSSQFPCSLIKNELLTVMYVTAKGKPLESAKGSPKKLVSHRKGSSSDLVVFHVLTKGGRNVTKIMRNSALTSKAQEITVFAYKGEKVKTALKKDGRFLSAIFKKNLVLSNVSSGVYTEMLCLVDDLCDKTFEIKLLDRENPPDSQPSSLEEDVTPTDCQYSPVNQDKQNHLSLRFRESVRGRPPVPKLTRQQNLFRQEFGHNSNLCSEVKTMKKMMCLSDSVCQVRANGSPCGSGFLLFSNYVLTNAHVVKDMYDVDRQQLSKGVTVHFSFESLNPTECGSEVEVDAVVGYEYCSDVSGRDWALLRLKADQTPLPCGLLKYFGFHYQSKGICVIGHPSGGLKMIDPCVIIPPEYDSGHSHLGKKENQEYWLLTRHFFERTQKLYYESPFCHGSSGSPVFDKHCHVVAVHTQGFFHRDITGETGSVIGCGHPLSTIVENIVVQLVERGRFDVLTEYLGSECTQHQNIMTEVKKLVESRNNTLFKNAVNNALSTNPGTLKDLFEFFAKEEKSVSMEIESP